MRWLVATLMAVVLCGGLLPAAQARPRESEELTQGLRARPAPDYREDERRGRDDDRRERRDESDRYERHYDRDERDERDDRYETREQRGPRISAGEAASIASRQNGGGRVLSVQLAGDGSYYRVKLLNGGEVRVVEVPAE